MTQILRITIIRAVLALLIAGSLVAGCSSDDDNSSDSSDDDTSTESTLAEDEVGEELLTGTPEDVQEQMDTFIKQSEGDLCELFGQVKMIDEPIVVTTDDEADQRVDILITYLTALAEAAEDEFQESATLISGAVNSIEEDYASSDSKIDGATTLRSSSADEFDDVVTASYEIAQKCGPP